jgi:capsular exopolysaccharide synthesis family protein
VPLLGTLPRIARSGLTQELGGRAPAGGASAAATPSRYAYASEHRLMEHVRMIRTALLQRIADGNERILLVTSALPRTGKTSVALLLARSLAVIGRRVLLVETDLRRPTLGDRLGLTTSKGLYALLTKSAEEHQVILASGAVNLDVVLAGAVPESFDPELLATDYFKDCLRRWRERYDFVLLDSPPVLAVADPQVMAGMADGVILVLKVSYDRRTEAVDAYHQLLGAGANVLGTVVIGGEEGGGYNNRYRYYYVYGYRPKSETQGS